MTAIGHTPPPTRARIRASVLLPALGLITAAATQVDAAIVAGAFRAESPAPEGGLNFPWYGDLAAQLSTWWSFTGILVAVGFAALARSRTLRTSRVGRVGAWVAVLGAAIIVAAHFLSAANPDALAEEGIGQSIVAMFASATLLIGVGMTAAGVATLRTGTWRAGQRFLPLANGAWPFVMMLLIGLGQAQIAVGIMAALQIALGAALIAEEA